MLIGRCAAGITTDEPHLKEMADRVTNHALTSAALQAHGFQSLQTRTRTTDGGKAPSNLIRHQVQIPNEDDFEQICPLPGPGFVPAHTTLPQWSSIPTPQHVATIPPNHEQNRREKKTLHDQRKRARVATDPALAAKAKEKERFRSHQRQLNSKKKN